MHFDAGVVGADSGRILVRADVRVVGTEEQQHVQ